MDFLLELAKLIKTSPKLCLPCDSCENCPYNSYLYKSKDCHLCFSSSFLQSCYYLDISLTDKDCVDSDYLNNSELCYECLDCDHCYNCDFCRDCKNCVDSAFCYECRGCNNCFGCIGLNKKQFHVFNERYSKEEYAEKIKHLKKMGRDLIFEQTEKLRKNFAHPAGHIVNSENCFGDYISNSKNCFMSFNMDSCQDSYYTCDEAWKLKDSCDCDHTTQSELMYNSMSIDSCYNVNCSWWMVNCRDCEYGFCNQACENCFGCVYMQRHKHCILNKQYSSEEYAKKVAGIKEDLRKRGLYGKYLLMDAVELIRNDVV